MDQALDEPLTRGHKKKARTRRQLIDAAVRVIAQHGEAFTIGQIADEAGVSQGTFYNYFDDRDALLDAVLPEVLGGFAAGYAEEVTEPDPAIRFATITALALQRAADHPEETRTLLRLEPVHRGLSESSALDHLRADIDAGAALGRFVVAADGATIDVVVGAMLVASRRLADGQGDDDYIVQVVAQLLRSLGLDEGDPGEIARQAVSASRHRAHPRRIG